MMALMVLVKVFARAHVCVGKSSRRGSQRVARRFADEGNGGSQWVALRVAEACDKDYIGLCRGLKLKIPLAGSYFTMKCGFFRFSLL